MRRALGWWVHRPVGLAFVVLGIAAGIGVGVDHGTVGGLLVFMVLAACGFAVSLGEWPIWIDVDPADRYTESLRAPRGPGAGG